MEIDTLAGLPAHPLFVHVPVILVPMAALAAGLLALFPRLIRRWGWWVVGLAGVGAVGAILAAGSGEGLEDRVEETAALERHTDLGEVARNVSIVLFVVVLALVLAQRFITVSRIRTVVASILMIVTATGAAGTIAAAGHSGAESVWSERIDSGEQKYENDAEGRTEDPDDEKD